MGAMFTLALVACGDNVTNESITQIMQDHVAVVSDASKLPDCTTENEGEQAFVKGERVSRICVDGSWQALLSAAVDKQGELKCTTENLADGSGVKILCNGDSIGVLLNGANGADGANGTNGKSAYEIAKAGGYTGTETEWLESLKGAEGAKGTDGKNGTNGKSAYEIAKAGGYVGTETEWLESLKGADGAKGSDGKNGTNGKSAYEIAKDGGYTGTETEWLESLKGTDANGCFIGRFRGHSSISCGNNKVLVFGDTSVILIDSIYNVLIDARDQKRYRTILIGEQVWMAENLNYGDSVSYPALVGERKYGCYNNLSENCEKYGRLYSWSVAMDSAGVFSTSGKDCGFGSRCTPTYPVRGICPEGWHLPTKAEFETLVSEVGGDSVGGLFLKSLTGWKDGGNGMEVEGFSAYPAGIYQIGYQSESMTTRFWTSNGLSAYKEYHYLGAYCMLLEYDNDFVFVSGCAAEEGFSIRCLKD